MKRTHTPCVEVSSVALRRRIELIQDFSMPVAATSVAVSRNGQYVFAAGVYKPRVRCYDLSHLSMKFERCIDSEVVDLNLLSEDYTKVSHSLAQPLTCHHVSHHHSLCCSWQTDKWNFTLR